MFDPGQRRNKRIQERRGRKRNAEGSHVGIEKRLSVFDKIEKVAVAAGSSPASHNPELENLRRFRAGHGKGSFIYQPVPAAEKGK